jgi:RNA polymerase-binding transcription factor DksA
MPVNDKLKRLGVGRTTKRFVGKSPVDKVVTETIEKTPIKRLSEVEQFKKELDNISKKAELIRATEDELDRIEDERQH